MQQASSLQRSIIITLAYTDQFQYPLTTAELWLRLICFRPSPKQFADALAALANDNLVSCSRGYWSLNSKLVHSGLLNRAKGKKYSAEKIVSFAPVIHFARACPWVAGLAITGSAAMNNAALNDDVDVLVVAENNRLWLVRPLLIVLAFIYGRRRSWSGEEPNSWCFNLWLERQSLQLVSSQRSLYTAYEACQAKWLVSKGGVHWEFLQTNRWIESSLPHLFNDSLHTPTQYGYQLDTGYVPLLRELLNIMNVVVFQLQLLYMKRHITTERVGYSAAFFHPRQTGKIIYKGWQKQLGSRN